MACKYTLAFVALLCLTQGIVCEEKTVLEDLAFQAQNVLSDLGKAFQETIKELPSSDKVVEVITDNSKKFADDVGVIVTKLNEEIKKSAPGMEQALNEIVGNLTQTIEKLKKSEPANAEQAQKLQETLKAELQKVATEAEALGKSFKDSTSGVRENIEKIAKDAYDKVVEVGKKVDKQLREQLDSKKKSA